MRIVPAMSKAFGLSLSALCYNLTIQRDGQAGTADQIAGPLSVRFSAELSGNASTNGSSASGDGVDQSGPEFSSRDKHALLYIIVVLLFYSTGIVIAIVNYLKREKKEIEEEKAYEDYAVFRSDPDKMARYFRVQRMISYLNRVEEAREATAIKERLQGRASCPLPVAVAMSTERLPNIRVAGRFSVGGVGDHVIRGSFRHKSHHVVPGAEAEVDDVRLDEQGASVDCGDGGVGEYGDEATEHAHTPLSTRVSHV